MVTHSLPAWLCNLAIVRGKKEREGGRERGRERERERKRERERERERAILHTFGET